MKLFFKPLVLLGINGGTIMKKMLFGIMIMFIAVTSALYCTGPQPGTGYYGATFYCLPRVVEENIVGLDHELVNIGNFPVTPGGSFSAPGQMKFWIYGPSIATYLLTATVNPYVTDITGATFVPSDLTLDESFRVDDLYGAHFQNFGGNLNMQIYLTPDPQVDCNSFATVTIYAITIHVGNPILHPANDLGLKYFHATCTATATL